MRKKILVVEDDGILQKALREALEEEGYAVEQAFDGEEGWKKINHDRPHLVLLDLLMPKKSGEWVLERMNEEDMMECCPVVVLTVKEDQVTMDECLVKYRVRAFAGKSFYTLEQVLETVREVMK